MASFISNQNRDASDVVRGYVYQVDWTILRWLKLEPLERLELESGEDIDLISECKLTGNEQRLLEQIKNLTGSVTLWSAVGAIANFVEHQQRNPSSNLRFLFTTTASITIERPSPKLLKRQPGILVWEGLRQHSLEGISQVDALNGLRRILSKNSRPEKISTATWNIFRQFILTASDADLLALIRNFQWSTTASNTNSLNSKIIAILLQHQYAATRVQAKELYQRLFLYVMKLLALPRDGLATEKVLTSAQLTEEMARSTLSDHDHALLENVVAQICNLSSRVEVLEETVQQFPDAISTQIQQQLQAQGFGGLSLEAESLDLEMPPLVECLSTRREVVKGFSEHFQQCTWLAINGINGSGKTHLAALIAQYLNTKYIWLSLRNRNIEILPQFIYSVMKCVAQISDKPNQSTVYQRACECLGINGLIVLDDLPQLCGDENFSRILVQLGRICQDNNVKLLSTSSYSLPLILQEALCEDALRVESIPDLCASETAEILMSYGASVDLINTQAKFLNTLAKGHPQIVVSIARYLQQHQWVIDDYLEESLWRGDYQLPLNEETIQKILKTVSDEYARELLYRLCLPVNRFSSREVTAVATINPPIQRTFEKLSILAGLWIQRGTGDFWQVSPLVKPLGEHNLLPNTKRSCHLALGEVILEQRVQSPSSIENAIIHFLGAEECDRAGMLLVVALDQLINHAELVDDGSILSFWFGAPLPLGMSVGVQTLLRAYQITARYRYKKTTVPLLEDLDLLLEQASEEDALMVFGAIGVLMANSFAPLEQDTLRAHRYFRKALQFLPFARNPATGASIFPDSAFIGFTIWTTVTSITTSEQLSDWMTTVESLTPKQRHLAFSHEIAEVGCMMITEKLWLVEEKKNSDQQDWRAIFDACEDFGIRAKQLNLELLWAYTVRAQITIQGVYCQNLNTAKLLAETALRHFSGEPRICFVIEEAIGSLLVRADCNNEALTWLSRALGDATNVYPKAHLRSLLNMACATKDRDLSIALEFTRQAVVLAELSPGVDELMVIKTLAESALAQWFSEDYVAAFNSWDRSCERLLAFKVSNPDNEDWKGYWNACGHVTGYFISIAETRRAPSRTPEGEPYAVPYLGMFSRLHPQLAAYYAREKDCVFFSNLARLAKSIGDSERSLVWAIRGLDDARLTNQNIVFAIASMEVLPTLLQNYCFAEVLDIAIDATEILTAAAQQLQAGQALEDFSVDVESILSVDAAQESEAERRALMVGLLPTVFQLGTLLLQDYELAQHRSVEVAAICRQLGEEAHNSQRWFMAADFVEQLFSSTASHDGVLRNSQGSDQDVLQSVGYLVASLQTDASLQMVIKEHFEIAYFASQELKNMDTIQEQIITPFFIKYWRAKFRENPLAFGSTQLVGRILSDIDQVAEPQQLPVLLGTAAFSLGVELPQHIAQWIYTLVPSNPFLGN